MPVKPPQAMTGEARLVGSHGTIGARHVIHAVGPKYVEKYAHAAASAPADQRLQTSVAVFSAQAVGLSIKVV